MAGAVRNALTFLTLMFGFGMFSINAPVSGQVPEQDIAAKPMGQSVYENYCASCHGQNVPRAPDPEMMEIMTPESVLKALNSGVMVEQAAPLTVDERAAVAEFLTGKTLGQANADPGLKACQEQVFDAAYPPTIRDWGIDLKNHREQSPIEVGLPTDWPAALQLDRALVFPDTIRVRSQPAFAGGMMVVGSQDGAVYAMDIKTGCQLWKYQAVSEVRTSIAISDWSAGDTDSRPVAVFADYVGNFYGLDLRSGTQLWKLRPEEHPHATISGTPRIVGERVYVTISSHEDATAARPDYPCCTFRGAVAALDLKTGETIWLTHTIEEEATLRGHTSVGTESWGPSGAATWTTPAIDLKRGQIYIGTGDNYSAPATGTSDSVIAIDMETGKINWVFQATKGDTWNPACMLKVKGPNCPAAEGPDYDFGASIILSTKSNGDDIVLAGQKSGAVFGMDPDTGKMLWRNKIGRGGIQGGVHLGMAASGGLVFVPVSDMYYHWDDETYDTPPRPGLYAVDIDTGVLAWAWKPSEDTCKDRAFCNPGISAPPTVIGDYVMVGGLDGWLRVHDTRTGKTVWKMDSTVDIEGFNGVIGHGGSINGTGPVAHAGVIYLSSGYGIYGHMPGNVILMFKPARAGKVKSELSK